MSAIVGKNGTQWNAKKTIEHDNPEQVKILARVLLEQRNEMYDAMQSFIDKDAGLLDIRAIDKEDIMDKFADILKKARGE